MFRSIRFRLTLWYAAVVALTFVFASGAIYEYVGRTLSTSLDQAITNEVKWIVARLEKGHTRSEAEHVVKEDIFEHASYYPIKEYIEIWDLAGALIYQSPNLAAVDTLAIYFSLPTGQSWGLTTITKFRTHNIRLAVSKTPEGTVYLAMPTESITAPLDQLVRVFALLGPVIIVIAIAGGTYLAKKSFVKINQVIETAKRITADRLYDRIPEHTAKDEIGEIISTFNDMISRLDVSFRQMKQFSADASHELRTPLSVMRTQLETALGSKATMSVLKKTIANCLDETLRMSGIIENLLLLAKGDSGQELIVKEPLDLRKLLSEAYDECVIIASQKSIKVTLKQPDEAMILGDGQRLRQMLLNLIDNAVKYNHENGKISFTLVRENSVAKISIADNGIGIPEHDIPRIFDRFYRVDRAKEMPGVGLGLSIAKWIAEAHGGTISVVSQLNKGSEFIVALPLLNGS